MRLTIPFQNVASALKQYWDASCQNATAIRRADDDFFKAIQENRLANYLGIAKNGAVASVSAAVAAASLILLKEELYPDSHHSLLGSLFSFEDARARTFKVLFYGSVSLFMTCYTIGQAKRTKRYLDNLSIKKLWMSREFVELYLGNMFPHLKRTA